MADNINLLPEQAEVADGKSKQNALINKISAVILVVTIAAVAGVFAYNFVLGQVIAGLDSQVAEQKAQIDQYKETEGVYRSAAMRMDAVTQFLGTQNHYSRALVEINKAVPGGVNFENLAISAEKTVTLSGTATAYSELSGFLAKLKSATDANNAAYFVDPNINSINRDDQSSSIDFNITFKLNNTLVVGQTSTQN